MQGSAEDIENLRRNLVDKSIESSIDLNFPAMRWTEEDVIMEVGCGPGRITKNILLPRCPKFKKIVAIDINPNSIHYARETYFHEKIEYKTQDILQSAELEGTEKYDKILAFYVFHYIYDYDKLFSVISSLLKPGGYFLFIYPPKFPMYKLFHELSFYKDWNKYVKTEDILAVTPPSEYWKDTEKEFKNFVSTFGLRVMKSKSEVWDFEYSSKQNALDAYFATLPEILFKNLNTETKARLWKLAEPIAQKSCLKYKNDKIQVFFEVLQVSGMKTC